MSAVAPLLPLLSLLRDMRSMIVRMDDESYAAPAPGRTGGGIGGHVRHCLDHVLALVTATRTGLCAYDRRTRGTDVETCRAAALRLIAHLEARLSCIGSGLLEAPVNVETRIDRDGSTFTSTSTVGREILFVTSHTIHHNAVVVYLLRSHGVDMGPRFGLAPSTPDRDERPACAR